VAPTTSSGTRTPTSHLKERSTTPTITPRDRSQESTTKESAKEPLLPLKESPKERSNSISISGHRETSNIFSDGRPITPTQNPINTSNNTSSNVSSIINTINSNNNTNPIAVVLQKRVSETLNKISSDTEIHSDKSEASDKQLRDVKNRTQRRSLSTSGEKNLPSFRSRKLSTAS